MLFFLMKPPLSFCKIESIFIFFVKNYSNHFKNNLKITLYHTLHAHEILFINTLYELNFVKIYYFVKKYI